MVSQVNADAVVHCDAERARTRLAEAVGAPTEWTDIPARLWVTVGPNRRFAPHKRVRARFGPPREHRESSVSSLWWLPTGRLAGMYPALRAGLAITEIDETSCLLAVVGEYAPPLGRVGAVADRAALHRIATATLQDFTNRLARALVAEQKEEPR